MRMWSVDEDVEMWSAEDLWSVEGNVECGGG